ncbi:Protein CBG21872 [Caenorhabditis briggsae]|uniref:Protein CBG21872 n=1 Tax=Caenorhabditis briggsae TaxID=6238 RepID=A8Y111_CAEBR|nr:Protein CBG21872 [Caenorhabditis briggsae]CAP38580.1 Protein CBG21872 [Caenorhabditis briggsae]
MCCEIRCTRVHTLWRAKARERLARRPIGQLGRLSVGSVGGRSAVGDFRPTEMEALFRMGCSSITKQQIWFAFLGWNQSVAPRHFEILVQKLNFPNQGVHMSHSLLDYVRRRKRCVLSIEELKIGEIIEKMEKAKQKEKEERENLRATNAKQFEGSSYDTVQGILSVADMFDTPIIVKKCEEFLLEKSKKGLKRKLELAGNYRMEGLKKQCLDKIKSKADIRSVIPADPMEMDNEILAELLKKALILN